MRNFFCLVISTPAENISCSSSGSISQARLTKGEIRLLHIYPGSQNDTIQLHTERQSFQHARDYEAISYTWGQNTTGQQLVFVDGARTMIGPNLHRVLRRVRRRDQPRVVWADELSINQADDDEIIQQVRHMHVIYPQARRVLCHLGEDDGTIKLAFQVLQEWAAAWGEGKAKDKMKAELVEKTRRQVARGSPELQALRSLWGIRWWRRAWTLQEVCVDPSKPPLLICGDHELSWEVLYYGCMTMFSSLRADSRAAALGSAVGYVLPMLRVCYTDKSQQWLSQLIPLVATREAGMQTDLIHSLLGMTPSSGRHYPPADPKLTSEQVSIRYTRAIINAEHSLYILLTVAEDANGGNFPSWAIKLNNLGGARSPLDPNSKKTDGTMHHFNATRGIRPVVGNSHGDFDRVLQLDGLPIDTLARSWSANDVLRALSGAPISWPQVLERAMDFGQRLGGSNRYGGSRGDTCEAIMRVMTADDFYTTTRVPMQGHWAVWEGLWISYKRKADEQGKRWGPRLHHKEELMQYVRRFIQIQPSASTPAKPEGMHRWLEETLAADFLRNVRTMMDGRALFRTRQGYIGLGPSNAQPGDHVCLLYGATTPFVLRGASSLSRQNFRLLDEAYVEGFMYGEGVPGSGQPHTYALI